MTTITIFEAISAALSSTNPHDLFVGTKTELQTWLNADIRPGIVLWVDLEQTDFTQDRSGRIPLLRHSARFAAIRKAPEIDALLSELATADGLEALIFAVTNALIPTGKANAGSVQMGRIRALKSETVEGFGGLETNVSFTTNQLC